MDSFAASNKVKQKNSGNLTLTVSIKFIQLLWGTLTASIKLNQLTYTIYFAEPICFRILLNLYVSEFC
jgi:hypothetical protein